MLQKSDRNECITSLNERTLLVSIWCKLLKEGLLNPIINDFRDRKFVNSVISILTLARLFFLTVANHYRETSIKGTVHD